jgi:hypothetical protein
MKTYPDDPITLLSKREYFASVILQGVVAAKYPGNSIADDICLSVNMADELIKTLNL